MEDAINLRIQRILDGPSSSESENSDDSQETAGRTDSNEQLRRLEHNVPYDISLPTLHSYLGNDLEELSGRTYLDDDSCQTIPVLSLPGVILVPGQVLPLQLYNPSAISMMIHIIHNDRTFGLINSRFSGRQFGNVLDIIGTTAEIRSYREEEGIYGANVLRIKAEGRQRFEVLETRTQSDGILIAKVRILPELSLGDAGECSKLNSLRKFVVSPPNLEDNKISTVSCKQLLHRNSHKYNKYDYANYTWFPEFVYKMYDPIVLMDRIKLILKTWNRSISGTNLPCDPKEFSYWIAANLPLDDNQRMDLLKINEVTQRLILELKILQKNSVLCCKDCQNIFSFREDIFSMSLQGPQGTYVNPNGYVHEAITVSNASGLSLVGRPSVEQSWFPGYAWTIVECSACHCHMGWKFTAVDKSLKPSKFYALCRSAIQNRIAAVREYPDENV